MVISALFLLILFQTQFYNSESSYSKDDSIILNKWEITPLQSSHPLFPKTKHIFPKPKEWIKTDTPATALTALIANDLLKSRHYPSNYSAYVNYIKPNELAYYQDNLLFYPDVNVTGRAYYSFYWVSGTVYHNTKLIHICIYVLYLVFDCQLSTS